MGLPIGRLGPLAAGLGVGVALSLGGPAIAGADSGEGSPGGHRQPSASADRVSGHRGRTVGGGRSAERKPAGGGSAARPAAAAGKPAKLGDRAGARQSEKPAAPSYVPVTQRPAEPSTVTPPAFPPGVTAPTSVDPARKPPPVAPTAPAAAVRPAQTRVAGIITGLKVGGSTGDTPVLPSAPALADLTAVAFVRRETTANARGSSLFRNATPTLNPSQTGQSVGGVATGALNATDRDSATLTYDITRAPNRGSVVLGSDGAFTYTADPVWAATGTTDSFEVSVSDEASGFHVHGFAGWLNRLTNGRRGTAGHTSTATVSVAVTPFGATNHAPTGSAVVGTPDPGTGVVTGTVSAADVDGDPLTYSSPSSTAKGAVTVSAAGAFTYTPTATARHNAAALGAGAGDRADAFTVTVSDGRGGTAAVPVTVAVGPANAGPVLGITTAGTPDAGTGVVAGRVDATDADGDVLAYSAPSSTAKGSVAVNAGTGSFTYTPTVAARQNAAAPGATQADRQDSFTVTVTDGHGGSVSAAVTVPVSPSTNNPPTGVAVVGSPNPATGVVTGSVSGSDVDGDALNYAGSAVTAKGSVTVSAAGAFTYTPTATARHNAAAVGAGAGDRADAFTVTVSDGRGGTATVPVTVAVSPANVAPVAGTTVGSPDAGTGVVSGRVNGTDADGDVLAYSAPSSTAKGSVAVNAGTGAFTYIPTVAARQNAAAPGATQADRQDSFTVTVTDGHGGSVSAAVTVQVSPLADPGTPLAAFPGAEGFGAYATGGRGGSVVYVTNLNANGPGSLQWAIDQPGAKYILFKVSGVIDTQIHLTNGNVTIAGQTSPGGITVRGLVTDESPYQDQAVQAPADFAENWILQHIRIRPGADGPSDDGLRIRYTRNAIVDHVSIGNATDEAIEISYSHDITVQNTLIAETVGGHSLWGGILMNYSNPAYGFGLDNVSLHHNVFNRIEGRLPEGSRESLAAANSYMNLEMSDNLYWDPGYFVTLGLTTNSLTDAHGDPYPIYWNLNAVNNYFRTSSGFIYGMFDDQILRTPRNNLYVSGNKMSLYPTRSDYQLFYCCNDYQSVTDPADSSQQAHRLATRNPFPAITYTPTDQLVNLLLNNAGAWPRDPMDIRLMRSVATNTIAAAPRNTNPAGDALLTAYSGPAPAAPTDTDNDGMPDTWESARGLNPNVANTNAHSLSAAGYTDLDVYLSELSASRVTGWAG